jgi:hypothetical protein
MVETPPLLVAEVLVVVEQMQLVQTQEDLMAIVEVLVEMVQHHLFQAQVLLVVAEVQGELLFHHRLTVLQQVVEQVAEDLLKDQAHLVQEFQEQPTQGEVAVVQVIHFQL